MKIATDAESQSNSLAQSWNTDAYAANGRFVATMASGVVDLLAPRPGEQILDVGCGDGALTETIAATGAIVRGVDNSPTMLAAAKKRGLEVDQHSADALPYQQQFDAVFSNAALHWLPEDRHPLALQSIHRALKPGGRFVAEMGGQGNVAAIRTALSAVFAPYGIDTEEAAASFYPAPAIYRRLLEAAGFTVDFIELIPRPTPLHGGMAAWLETFRNGVLNQLSTGDRAAALERTVSLLEPILRDGDGNWVADYIRLRFAARAQS